MEEADKEFEYEKLKMEHDWRLHEMRYKQQSQVRLLALLVVLITSVVAMGLYVYRSTFDVPNVVIESIKESDYRAERIQEETRRILNDFETVLIQSKKLEAQVEDLRVRQDYLESEISKIKNSNQ